MSVYHVFLRVTMPVFSAFDINTAKHFSVFILFEYLLVSSITTGFNQKLAKYTRPNKVAASKRYARLRLI